MNVKRLEWKEDWGGSCDDIPEWRASTPWGSLSVSMAGHRDDDGKPYERHSDVPNGLRISLLSDAEDRYAAKVLSALTNPSGDDEAPVMQQGRYWIEAEERWSNWIDRPVHYDWSGVKHEYRYLYARPQSAAVRDDVARLRAIETAAAYYVASVEHQPLPDIWDTESGAYEEGAEMSVSDRAWKAHDDRKQEAFDALRAALHSTQEG